MGRIARKHSQRQARIRALQGCAIATGFILASIGFVAFALIMAAKGHPIGF